MTQVMTCDERWLLSVDIASNRKGAGYPAPFLFYIVRLNYFAWQSLHLVGPAISL